MNQDKLNRINTYIVSNVAPILVEGISASSITNSVVIPANCGNESLNGHYEGMDFVPPKWYMELLNKKDMKHNILVIENLTSIPVEEQVKFCEILKYRKISTFELPNNCAIIITCDKVEKGKVAKEVYSLVAHIKE